MKGMTKPAVASFTACSDIFSPDVLAMGAAVVGFLAAPMAWWERLLAFAAGVLLVLAVPLTDEVGWTLAVLWVGWHWMRARRLAVAV